MEETKVKENEMLENEKTEEINLNFEDPLLTDDMDGEEKIIEKGYRYLTFELDKEDYGVRIEYVIEIIGIQDITHLPGMPNYVKGLLNLRGKIIPIIDAREKFGKVKKEYNDRTCVVVLEINSITVGLVVDIISDVITILEREIEEAPNIGKIKANKYIKEVAKVENKVKLLIDCEKLINE